MKKHKRKAWWSKAATSPKALKKWFADRGRDIKPAPAPKQIIWYRETREEFIKRLEKIAEERQKEKKQRKEKK